MPDAPFSLVEVPPRRTAVIAAVTTWQEFPQLWRPLLDEVYTFVRASPELNAAAGEREGPRWTNVMLYRDQRPSVEVGVLAPAQFAPQGRIIASELPGGQAITATHRGDPATIGRTHNRVRTYADTKRLETTGVLWEVYGHPDDSGAFATEVFHLLA